MATRSETVLETSNLRKSYGTTVALDGVDFQFSGRSLGVVGPNGAGKTTLIRLILGLLVPDGGTVTVLGAQPFIHRRRLRDRVGYVPESSPYVAGMDGVSLVRYAGELTGMPGRSALRRAHEMLDFVGVGEERYRNVSTYSAGMFQRMKLAAAIVHGPQLLLLDEPTSGMDPGGRSELLSLICSLVVDAGISIILSTHILHDVEVCCGDVAVLGDGKVLLRGSVDDLREVDERRFDVRLVGDGERFAQALQLEGCGVIERGASTFRVSVPTPGDATPIFRAATGTSTQVRRLEPTRSTLEEAYLKAVGED